MKILFFRPAPPKETIGLQHVMIVEPLELELMASLAEAKHKVQITDLILEKNSAAYFIENFSPDLLCLTGYITHTHEIKSLCRLAKAIKPEILTAVGGVYAEQVPEAFNDEYIDFRVVRNAVKSFPQLLNYIDRLAEFPAGVLKFNEISDEKKLPDYDFNLPIPNRTLTQKYRKKYFYVFHNKVALLKTSFGCPYPCSFCFCRKITGDNYFERELSEVISELKTISEKEVYIIDDNFLVSKKRVREFLRLLEAHKINKKYLIYGRADFIAENPKLMQQFKKQGLRTIIVGFESFDDEELNSLNKKTAAATNEKAMHILNKNGIDCYASVIAMPEWSQEDFRKASQKLIELKVRFLNIQPLTPLEKTDFVFDDKDLIISRKDYAKWDLAHIIIKPKKMPVKVYYREILSMYEKVLFRPSNLWHHLKYPLYMQFKLLRGAYKVWRQYRKKINQTQ